MSRLCLCRITFPLLLLSLCPAAAVAANSRSNASSAPPVSASLIAPIQQAFDAVARVPGSAPATAVVIVQGDASPWMHVQGRARADADRLADADTRFYIASQTKSFVGLLAAVLDERGELPLTTTLAEIWPELQLPAPADARKISMADLLSHQEGLSTDTLNFLTAYVRDVPAADYPALLAMEVKSRTPGFRYANLGDLVYGAALEARTGRNWRDWLDEAVLRPLQLDDVSPRTTTVPVAQLSWNHQWDGERWRALEPKPDAVMHAAGGLVASPRAMARWMQANLGTGGARAGFADTVFERSQQPIAQAKLADGEIDCDGYSLGWYACGYRGQRALMHPGSFNGAVSVTVLVPTARAGMSIMVNSDSAMEGLQLELMKAFIGLATGQAGEDERLRKVVAEYPARVEAKAAKRRDAIDEERKDPQWGGWQWEPDAAMLLACSGEFANPLYGTMRISRDGPQLSATIGAVALRLEPAQPGLFGASGDALEPPEPLRCEAEKGLIHWREQAFLRTPS